MKEYDLVVFNENHKWFPCIGYIREIKPNKIMVGVQFPNKEQGTYFVNKKILRLLANIHLEKIFRRED